MVLNMSNVESKFWKVYLFEVRLLLVEYLRKKSNACYTFTELDCLATKMHNEIIAGILTVRELSENNIEALVRYWMPWDIQTVHWLAPKRHFHG